MQRIVFSIICLMILVSCVAHQPTDPPSVTLTIDGNVTEVIDGTKEHPCEGNWNFCDQVMDDLDSFYIPAF